MLGQTQHLRGLSNRAILLALMAICMIGYVWFFQGDSWAGQSHYCTMRSLAERGTFEITPFKDRTGDISIVNHRVYSNKPPGIALIGTIPYAMIAAIERAARLDPASDRVDQVNIVIMTILLSAIPAMLTVSMFFVWLRRDGAGERTAFQLSLALAFGSIFWPYSGVIGNHLFFAMCLLAAWMLVSGEDLRARRIVAATMLLFLAGLSEYLAIPIIMIFIACEWIINRRWQRSAVLIVAPILAVVALLIYQRQVFGNPFASSYAFEDQSWRDVVYPSVRFHSPIVARIYWITFHRMRGLFYCSPMFALALMSPLLRRKWPDKKWLFNFALIAFLLAFYMCYLFWTGGAGVGPRYAIPALAFIFIFARRAFSRLPWLGGLLIAISVFNMLAVTSVETEFPANETGAPQQWDPVGVSTLDLLRGHLSLHPHSYNLGLLLGLRGSMSIIPIALLIVAAFVIAAWKLNDEPDQREKPGDNAARASGRIAPTHAAYMSAEG